jgi:Xaa-Pro aminopeptidase
LAKTIGPAQQKLQNQHAPVSERLTALRALMAKDSLDVYWVPSSDEHLNEYLPEAHKRREWITGFSGSAGDALIMCDEAWAYVDSRYYEQADYEVDARYVNASKVGLDGHPTLRQTLTKFSRQLTEARGPSAKCRVGFDPATLGLDQYLDMQSLGESGQIEWVPVLKNGVDVARANLSAACKDTQDTHQAAYHQPIFSLPVSVTGEGVASKLDRVRALMKQHGVQYLPVVKLDQVAWLFNLRGQDIPYNPVFLSYALVTETQAMLFVDEARLTDESKKEVSKHATIHPYADFAIILAQALKTGASIVMGLDPKHVTVATEQVGKALENITIKSLDHPVQILKAVKNETEMAGMKLANLKASRGKIRALCWLSEQTKGLKAKANSHVSEVDFQNTIEAFYAEEPDYVGLSFNTIAGAGANSSIVHYGTPNPKAFLKAGQLFLIDSGVQFLHGTTDDTRTVVVGKPTPLQRKRYTAVLKAHIDCARQKYPKGTEGIRLDGIARSALWNEGLDYGHGTGHGVGAFLNVHEGPNGIHRMAKEPFQPGMITSIEPGYYEPGWGGIRLENLYASIKLPAGTSADGRDWYGFETLTYVPFDKNLIVFSSLSREQLQWLKQYYAAILRKLLPTLNPTEQRWLKGQCSI